MRQLLLLSIFSWITAGTLFAQSSSIFEEKNEALSPSEKRFNMHGKSMDIIMLNQLYSNPSYREWINTDESLFRKNKYGSVIYTGYANGDLDGDFLPYEGNGSYDYRIGGSGALSIAKGGTLFGSVRYTNGKHENIGWSGVRYPELYTPYISTDSIGGDFLYEDYFVEGGYAFTLNEWKIGVKGSFHGEQAHRKTDPRALNQTNWLNFGVGISRLYNGHLLMLDGTFGRNKQHQSLRYWRPGEQDRFFIGYGFGLYDVRQSKVAFGYSRMHYIREGSLRFTYQSPLDRLFTIYASLGYEYDRMKTEETNICDLYYSKTNTLLPTIRLDWNFSSPWKFSIWVNGRIDLRKGYENIFERYQSDVANNIYDYRLIDTQQNYKYQKADLLGQLRIRYEMNPQHSIGLTGGTSAAYRKESYNTEGYLVKNVSLFPHARLDYLAKVKKSEFEIAGLFGKKINIDNIYDVVMRNNKIEHLDFQHAFAPYAYYNCSYSSLQLSASYTYHFRKCALGINAKLMYTTGDRDQDARFDGEIGFESTAPMITKTPDKHDEIWGSSSLFFVF